MGLAPGTSPDPSMGMNVIKSDGFTHQWFPRQKAPSTEWDAQLDQLMDEQTKTLDYDVRRKIYNEVQAILAGTTTDDFHRHADVLRRDPLGHRQRPAHGLELLSRDLESAGALLQEERAITAGVGEFALPTDHAKFT